MKISTFIPARGGSTRVPNKNLARIGNYSLIQATVGLAVGTGTLNPVVSTDSEDIKTSVRELFGPGRCSFHERLPEHATDTSPVVEAIDHWWKGLERTPDVVILLNPTSPFRTSETLHNAVQLIKEGASNVVGVKNTTQEIHFRLLGERKKRQRTQDLPTCISETGALYAWTREHWEEHKDIAGGRREEALLLNDLESFDINTPFDLKFAQIIARGLKESLS